MVENENIARLEKRVEELEERIEELEKMSNISRSRPRPELVRRL
jgi:chaperonin cofactor prefoldin